MEVDDLLQPVGPLSPSFFPGRDAAQLDELLSGFITDAQTKAAALPADVKADAEKSWALWRAFDAIALRLATTPSSATQDGDSRSYSGAQAQLMRNEANRYYQLFRGIEIAYASSVSGLAQPSTQGAVPIVFST